VVRKNPSNWRNRAASGIGDLCSGQPHLESQVYFAFPGFVPSDLNEESTSWLQPRASTPVLKGLINYFKKWPKEVLRASYKPEKSVEEVQPCNFVRCTTA
jgi:hypothetical protein